MTLYPLEFTPILHQKIWGGTQLQSILNKKTTSKNIGESWEISTVANNVSIIANGIFKGKNLNELIAAYPKEILGEKVITVFGKQFPLLFKFIDAKENLSIQVHPNDELAKKKHNSFGKTEMWYVMNAKENAELIVGFKEKTNQETYLKFLKENKILHLLNQIKVKEGDVFFLETGTIHAIGAGILLAEIQQTSDITYRIYDWDRVDNKKNKRELHTDLALEAINYKTTDTQIHYTKKDNQPSQLVHCNYFKTNILKLNKTPYIWKQNTASFTVFMCVDGEITITYNTFTKTYYKGETILLPATILNLSIKGTGTILEVYI